MKFTYFKAYLSTLLKNEKNKMTKKEELHALIHALSRSEKRYFKLFCRREAGGDNYLKLFDAIEAQAAYDEADIKKRFSKEKFVKQLHVTKHYLRNMILKSLRNFHAGLSRDAQLKDLLRNVEILYSKELFPHCMTELKRADALARQNELAAGMVEVGSWKRRLEQVLRPHHYEAFGSAVAEQEKAVRMLQNNIRYWQLAVEVSASFFRQGNLPAANMDLLSDPDNALTLEAKVLYYNSKYLQYIREDKPEEAGGELYTLIELLEAHPQRIRSEPGIYVSSVNNLLSYLVFRKRYEEALQLITKAKTAYGGLGVTSENRMLLKQILRTFNIELEIYRDRKVFGEKAAFIENTEGFIDANVHKMPREYLLSFWFQLASIHFMRKDFSRSLHWINRLLNARFRGVRTDLQVQAQMLNLMVHFEQQNLFVLRYYVDSARRFMKKVKRVQPFEEALLRFFGKIGRLPPPEYKNAFAGLGRELFPENGEPLVPPDVLGYIDYREWIAQKIHDRTGR